MSHEWNDYAAQSTEELLERWAELRPIGERCDNLAPGTCCDECNAFMIADELSERLGKPVTL